MGPPSFTACFVCQKGFGSRSLGIHVPQCMTKWRKENDAKRKLTKNRKTFVKNTKKRKDKEEEEEIIDKQDEVMIEEKNHEVEMKHSAKEETNENVMNSERDNEMKIEKDNKMISEKDNEMISERDKEMISNKNNDDFFDGIEDGENNATMRSERAPSPTPPSDYPISLPLRPSNHHPTSSPLKGRKKQRPGTAKLDRPKVLNDTLRGELDMSKLTRDMLHKNLPSDLTTVNNSTDDSDVVVVSTGRPYGDTTKESVVAISSDYSSGDFTSDSPSPLGAKTKHLSGGDDDENNFSMSSSGSPDSDTESSSKFQSGRPSTMRLPRPTRHISVPVIIPTVGARAPPKRTNKIIKAYPPKIRKRNLDEVFTGPKDKMRIPMPCQTCGKEQNPERFHSHPIHMTKFKAKDKEKQNKEAKAKGMPMNKRIVTKPLPLMYKSKGTLNKVNKMSDRLLFPKSLRDYKTEKGAKKSVSEESLLNLDFKEKRKKKKPKETRSADNSPNRGRTRTKKKDGDKRNGDSDELVKTSTKLPLSYYKKKTKASINKKFTNTTEDDRPFTIDFYEKPKKKEMPLSPFHNPYRDGSFNLPRDDSPKEDSLPEPRKKSLPAHGSVRKNNVRGRRGKSNVIKRPNDVHNGSTFTAEDVDDIDKIVLDQPLENLPEGEVVTEFGSSDGRKISSIEEETRPDTMSKRVLLTCYICGREFGTRSLPIHEPRCLEKWTRENASLPTELQRPAPVKPDKALTKEEWNDFAWTASQKQLVPCWCGRTFLPERLLVHQKGCKPPPGKPKERPSSDTSVYETAAQISFSKPTVSCYICGREFGTKSIAIHQPNCLNKWKKENEKLPPEQRKADPKVPEMIYDADGNVDKEAMDEAAWQSHLQTLVKCNNCPRTFLPERLEKHQKSCKGEGTR